MIVENIGYIYRRVITNKIEILPNLWEKLISKINNDFRTNDYRLLFGHSLAGVYIEYIFSKENGLFDVYFAATSALFVALQFQNI